ncbi:hypothetical protein Psfp_04290 [Pelotomaculum sp. FP]|nr:hypothetical protein Psfp_04290 [Pelotomaculum sp. FP]
MAKFLVGHIEPQIYRAEALRNGSALNITLERLRNKAQVV